MKSNTIKETQKTDRQFQNRYTCGNILWPNYFLASQESNCETNSSTRTRPMKRLAQQLNASHSS